MKEHRKHKRFKLNLVEAHGRMSLADKVEILDISLSGMAIKADRRLNIGKEYVIKLGDQGKRLDVRGVIVRSELCGIEQHEDGNSVSIYSAGVIFKEGQAEAIAGFLKSIEQDRTDEMLADRRMSVRFCITAPRENILSFPAHFIVKKISMGGVLIETEHHLLKESRVPMELSLNSGETVRFIGRVVSVQAVEQMGQTAYEIGVEFTDLNANDRESVKEFVDYLAALEKRIGEGT